MLGCGCAKQYITKVHKNELVYCLSHGKAIIVALELDNWNVACEECAFTKLNLGAAPLAAKGAAAKHGIRRRHRVRSYTDNGVVHYFEPSEGQLSLGGNPPF